MHQQQIFTLFFFFFFFCLSFSTTLSSTTTAQQSLLPSDAVSLLSFKSKADLNNKLLYTLNERFDYCQWRGVKCSQGRVVRFALPNLNLRGTFPPHTLSQLNELRVLSLFNNSLSGPLPLDLSTLSNLKTLILGNNMFSGSLPVELTMLYKLKVLDVSGNNLTGSLPVELNRLDRLTVLKLENNRFDGPVPALNLSFLMVFNVSWNNLSGKVPETPTLLRFGGLAFLDNEGVCGEIVNKACPPSSPFFGSNGSSGLGSGSGSNSRMPPGPLGAIAMGPPLGVKKKGNNRTGLVLGVIVGFAVVLAAALLILAVVRKQHGKDNDNEIQTKQSTTNVNSSSLQQAVNSDAFHSTSTAQLQQQQQGCSEVMSKAGKFQEVQRSGDLVFCAGEARLYSLEQLMRASAELLGRGNVGTTYKAVLDNQFIVTVKRLDASKTAITSSEVFERHMGIVGGLRHPNLVPVKAYFQSKGERLVIYEYQPNGSLFTLIHGSRSTRAKPLHWTSCLKIAEDVAQGLAYIHQTSKLVHGNLKSTNVLLGADFEACLTDYCLAVLSDLTFSEDADSAAYRAPETRKSSRRATSKSDVYAFGVLLLELLTGKPPSQHPYLVPTDLPTWVRAMRDDDGGEENQLGMLTEVASLCSVTSPEQRPAMWQVLNMIQEIKETALAQDNSTFGAS